MAVDAQTEVESALEAHLRELYKRRGRGRRNSPGLPIGEYSRMGRREASAPPGARYTGRMAQEAFPFG